MKTKGQKKKKLICNHTLRDKNKDTVQPQSGHTSILTNVTLAASTLIALALLYSSYFLGENSEHTQALNCLFLTAPKSEQTDLYFFEPSQIAPKTSPNPILLITPYGKESLTIVSLTNLTFVLYYMYTLGSIWLVGMDNS